LSERKETKIHSVLVLPFLTPVGETGSSNPSSKTEVREAVRAVRQRAVRLLGSETIGQWDGRVVRYLENGQ
jgi:hypothetical protein